ncbi:cytochrome c-type biogenesis protein CcmH [Bradyrhizobium sp. BR13661]|jgi:cytochrome c-type biogenesis protein CcmH|uniref:cytochrome c-type biogenesis protein n=1 Tax=Bradyrhizobium sp. BR13661 TaxID=2940622 RepID=UPI002475F90B|nr:cytochrome c-type biogenesis protein CcmH [Bradyrhizobium sp. BR13661]MDH6256442.1 cytochrome c-type biogenesis protein CcmH [Bradyrhizobium sp. BR13661]
MTLSPRIALLSGGILVLVLMSLSAPCRAVTPDEMLQDPTLEARARVLSQELRCVVCQNQSIDDSNAPLAHDLRVLLRDRLAAGDSDRQAIDFLVARYGNFVLLKPPMQLNTALLWIGPLLVLVLAALGFGRYVRNAAGEIKTNEVATLLTDDERERIEAILGERSAG